MVIAVLAAAPDAPANPTAPKQEPVKLASPGFTAVNVDDKLAAFFADHFAQQLALQGLRVLTASEISALVGFERQKQLLGCSENSQSCMAELANALGVDGLIVGSLAKFDTTYQVNLKIVSAADATPLAVFSGQAEGDKGMLAKLNEAAKAVAPEVLTKLGRAPVVAVGSTTAGTNGATASSATSIGDTSVTASATPAKKKWPLAPSIAGGLLMGAGGIGLAVSSNITDTIKDQPTVTDARKTKESANVAWYAGNAALAVGFGLAAGAAIYYFATPAEAPVNVAVAPTQGGAVVGVTGVLP